MSPFLDALLSFTVFPGLPIAALLIGSWFLFRRDRMGLFLWINLGVIGLVGLLAMAQPSDSSAPVPEMALVLYLILYIPAHLGVMALIAGIKVWLRRRSVPEDT